MITENRPSDTTPTVAVIGGGVSGLVATHYLLRSTAVMRVVLLESQDRLGGLLHTRHRDGFLIEEAADSFSLARFPELGELCQQIGLNNQLVPTQTNRQQTLTLHRGRLLPIPASFLMMAPIQLRSLFSTPILTTVGKLRLILEPLIPPHGGVADESIAEFVRRRMGREAYERLVQPLVEAIYSGDAARLSMLATMPQVVQMERRWGSLFRAAWFEQRMRRISTRQTTMNGRAAGLCAPREGMSSFVAALVRQLPPGTVQLHSPVTSLVRRKEGHWKVVVGGTHPRALCADAVILAVPANRAAELLLQVDDRLAGELRRIEYSPTIHVTLGFGREQLRKPLEAVGLFLPRVAGRLVRSATLCSEKFPGRAPPGFLQIRVSMRNDDSQSTSQLDDGELARVAATEIAPLLGIDGSPEFHHVVRHRQALPQYHVGHLRRLSRIENQLRANPGLALAGAAYHGIGVPQCMRSGKEAAEVVLRYLGRRPLLTRERCALSC